MNKYYIHGLKWNVVVIEEKEEYWICYSINNNTLDLIDKIAVDAPFFKIRLRYKIAKAIRRCEREVRLLQKTQNKLQNVLAEYNEKVK